MSAPQILPPDSQATIDELRLHLREVKVYVSVPRVVGILEVMLAMIESQQREIELLKKDRHWHYDPNNPEHVERHKNN